MLLDENLVNLIGVHLKFLNFIGPYPFCFDKINSALQSASTKTALVMKLTIFTLLSISFLSWIQLWLSWSDVPKVVTYEGMIYAGGSAVFGIGCYVYLVRNQEVIELFNLVVRFERRYNNSGFLTQLVLIRVPRDIAYLNNF